MKKSFISLIDKADPKTLETFFERVEPEKLPDETEKKLTARVVGTTKTSAARPSKRWPAVLASAASLVFLISVILIVAAGLNRVDPPKIDPIGADSTAAPEVTAPRMVDTTRAPLTTSAPDNTKAPLVTAAPDTTRAPLTTSAPETTAQPDVTKGPGDAHAVLTMIDVDFDEAKEKFAHPIVRCEKEGFAGYKVGIVSQNGDVGSKEAFCFSVRYEFANGSITLSDYDRMTGVHSYSDSEKKYEYRERTFYDQTPNYGPAVTDYADSVHIGYYPTGEKGIAYYAVFDADTDVYEIMDLIISLEF